MTYSISLAERDVKLKEIRNKIVVKKALLKRRVNMLTKELGENAFLSEILKDYKNYNQELCNQKKQQIQYFEMMNEYLENIGKDTSLTEDALIRAKEEQKNILEEMIKVKEELKTIIDKE